MQKYPPEAFCKKAVLKFFSIFTGKRLCWSLFLLKLQAFRSATFIKKGLEYRYFPVNIDKFLRTPDLKNIYERLFLLIYKKKSYFK